MFSNSFVNAIGQSTTFANPGWHGTDCDTKMITGLNKTVEDQDPSVIYVHVPFQDDAETSREFCNLKQFTEDQMKAGKTCIVADTRHTDRWKGSTPILCRGDLAFYCNNTEMCSELVEWAKEKDNGATSEERLVPCEPMRRPHPPHH